MVKMSLSSETSVFLACRGESTEFPVLVDRIADPVDSWVISDGGMCRVNQDYLKVLVSRILIEPVRIHNPESTQLSSCTLLCHRPLAALELELGNSLVSGLTIHDTLGNRPLATTSPNTDTVYHITLLGLVAQAASLVRASGVSDTNNGRKLAILPTSHPL